MPLVDDTADPRGCARGGIRIWHRRDGGAAGRWTCDPGAVPLAGVEWRRRSGRARAVRIRAECALCDIKRAGRAGSCRSRSCRLAIQTLPCFLDDTERTSCRISDRRYPEPRTVFGRLRDRRNQIVDRCTRRRALVEARIGRCPPRDGPLSRHSRCSRARPVVGRVVVLQRTIARRTIARVCDVPRRATGRHARQTACDRPRSDRARWSVQQLFSP